MAPPPFSAADTIVRAIVGKLTDDLYGSYVGAYIGLKSQYEIILSYKRKKYLRPWHQNKLLR